MGTYGARIAPAIVYCFLSPKLYEPAIVGIGKKGVEPFTVG